MEVQMSLSRIQSLRVSAVLEDCSDQLDIVGHALTVQISRESAATQEMAQLTKLRSDCQYISQQVFKLHEELKEKQSFSSLWEAVEVEERKKRAETMRRQAKRELEQRKQTVQRKQMEVKQKNKKLGDLDYLTSNLKFQLGEEMSQIGKKKKIVENTMNLKLEQTKKESSQAESRLNDQLELLQNQLKVEMRAHEESKKFLHTRHEESQQQLHQWQQCTKQMLQEKEQQLNSVSCKRTVNKDRLTEMRRRFREMEELVMEDREEQEKIRQQQEEVRAATKLQAWWRGCMVRQGLGSFKKTEEDKKGKKKKDGKKKKKKK